MDYKEFIEVNAKKKFDDVTEKDKKLIEEKAYLPKKCDKCGFIYSNSPKIRNVFNKLRKTKHNFVFFEVYCENKYRSKDGKDFACNFYKKFDKKTLLEAKELTLKKKCPVCGGNLYATGVVMDIKGFEVTSYCPSCNTEWGKVELNK